MNFGPANRPETDLCSRPARPWNGTCSTVSALLSMQQQEPVTHFRDDPSTRNSCRSSFPINWSRTTSPEMLSSATTHLERRRSRAERRGCTTRDGAACRRRLTALQPGRPLKTAQHTARCGPGGKEKGQVQRGAPGGAPYRLSSRSALRLCPLRSRTIKVGHVFSEFATPRFRRVSNDAAQR